MIKYLDIEYLPLGLSRSSLLLSFAKPFLNFKRSLGLKSPELEPLQD